MLKIGYPDLIEAKIGFLESKDIPYSCCFPGMYPACAMSHKDKIGHIDLIN